MPSMSVKILGTNIWFSLRTGQKQNAYLPNSPLVAIRILFEVKRQLNEVVECISSKNTTFFLK